MGLAGGDESKDGPPSARPSRSARLASFVTGDGSRLAASFALEAMLKNGDLPARELPKDGDFAAAVQLGVCWREDYALSNKARARIHPTLACD